jgi:hypothetical protein
MVSNNPQYQELLPVNALDIIMVLTSNANAVINPVGDIFLSRVFIKLYFMMKPLHLSQQQ